MATDRKDKAKTELILPKFLQSLVESVRKDEKPWVLAWPKEPIKDDSGELWISTCDRYAVKRRYKSDVYAILVNDVKENDANGEIIARNCKGVIGGMTTCAKHLAAHFREPEKEEEEEEEKEEKEETIKTDTSRIGQVQHHGRHRRSRGGTVASKIADRLRKATRDNPVTLSELAQINVDSTGADHAKAVRNTLWYLGHMHKGDRGMPFIAWQKNGSKYYVE